MNPILRVAASPVLFWINDRKIVQHLKEWKAANEEGNLPRAVELRDTFKPKIDEARDLALWATPVGLLWLWGIFAAIVWFWNHI